MRWIYFLIALWFVGCSSHPGNNITDMDNHIIFAYKKPKAISFYDENTINYPKARKNQEDLGFGDGILFYSLNTDIVSSSYFNIPNKKIARVYIKVKDKILKKDLEKSLKRFKVFEISNENNMIDFIFEAKKKKDNKLNIKIFNAKGKELKQYKNIDINNLVKLANSNVYLTIALNHNKYDIRQTVIIKKDIDKAVKSQDSFKGISFNEALDYCKKKETNGRLPELYLFEYARRLGYLHAPIGTTKEYISGYNPKNKRIGDKLPKEYISMIIFDRKTKKYIVYSKELKDDKYEFSDVAFRCMRYH